MPYYDFALIKRQCPIAEVARHLGIIVRPEAGKETLRGKCPVCEDLRSFTITPHGGRDGLDICGCFKCAESWDAIGLVKAVKGFDRMPEAAKYLIENFGGEDSTVKNSTVSKPRAKPESERGKRTEKPSPRSFDPEAFGAKLQYTPEVEALGISEEDAAQLGIGFHRGKLYYALRYPNGEVAGYGHGDLSLPKQLVPMTNVAPFRKKA
jgi:hypothetical protein